MELRSVSSTKILPIVSPRQEIRRIREYSSLERPTEKVRDSLRISNLSVKENTRVKRISPSPPPGQSETMRIETQQLPPLPNFALLIHQLDLVTGDRFLEEIHLKESEAVQIHLEEGVTQCFRISCKNKESPMKVTVKKIYGVLKYYLSRKVSKPNENQHDLRYLVDVFEVTTSLIWFNNEVFYLSAFAQEISNFSISVKFGRPHGFGLQETRSVPRMSLAADLERYRRDRNLREQLNNRVNELIKIRKRQMLEMARSKNYLELNKVSIASSVAKETYKWEERRELVFKRKHENMEQKKIRNTMTLNKHELNLEIKRKIIEETENEKIAMHSRRKLVALALCISCSSVIRQMACENRVSHLSIIRMNSAARVIQKNVKRCILNFPIKFKVRLRLYSSLLYFYKNTSRIISSNINSALVGCIKNSKANLQVHFKITKFLSGIIMIQKAIKSFQVITKYRMDNLKRIWNGCLSKLILQNSSNSNNKYLRITYNIRDSALRKYYHKCMRIYLVAVKASLEAINSLEPQRKTSRSHKYLRSKTRKHLMPGFNYLPSDYALQNLIELSLNH